MAALLARAEKRLAGAGIDDPRAEARLLLQEALGVSKASLLAHPETEVPPEAERAYLSNVERRARHEPAAYVTGHKEFFGLEFEVAPSVLVPRPETELLVEMAIDASGRLAAADTTALQAADLGTGSGAVAVALAVHRPWIHIIAVDSSAEALAVARRNAMRHGVAGRIDFRHGDLLDGMASTLDLLVANLPYVPAGEVDRLMPEVSLYEPRSALDGGPDGTNVIRRALEQARGRMKRPGVLLFEIGEGQGAPLSAFARGLYPGADIQVRNDYAGLERVLSVDLA